MENGPQDVAGLLELMFHKSSVYKAQATTNAITIENPFQNFINGIGGAINGGINGVSDAVGSVVNGGKNATNTITRTNGTNTSGNNPLGDFFGGVANGVGGLVGNVTNGVGGLVGNVTNGVGGLVGNVTNGVGGLVGNVTNGVGSALGNITTGVGGVLGNLTHIVTGNGTNPLLDLSNGIGGLIGSISDTAGNVLGSLTNGLINNDVLKTISSFAGTAIGGLINGSLSIGDIITNAIDQINKFTGGDNPLGNFIKTVATYLSNNQDSFASNLINLANFINTVIKTTINAAAAVLGNVSGGLADTVFSAVTGIIGKVFGGGLFSLHRLQNMSSEEVMTLQNIFVDAVRAQSPAGASYIQQIFDIVGEVVKKVLISDPTFLSFLTNPSEDNLRKAFSTVYKVVTEQQA